MDDCGRIMGVKGCLYLICVLYKNSYRFHMVLVNPVLRTRKGLVDPIVVIFINKIGISLNNLLNE